MGSERQSDVPLQSFTFRVLVDFDDEYGVYVSLCLETGAIATADDPKTAEDMMLELLESETRFALEHKNLTNLYSSPANLEIWSVWAQLDRDKTGTCHRISMTVNGESIDMSIHVAVTDRITTG